MPVVILDVATAPLENANDYIEDSELAAPDHYKDPNKIADFIERQRTKLHTMGALDFDLARLTAIGIMNLQLGPEPSVALLRTEDEERDALGALAHLMYHTSDLVLVTFNGMAFDLPMLMRRARYLGVAFPRLSLEPWKSPHLDLCLALRFDRPQVFKSHSLAFYVRRLGWTDLVKPLTGNQEAIVHKTGEWERLAGSVRHDVLACYRLGLWLGLYGPAIEPTDATLAEAIL
jgi:hypothetical protein